MPCGRRNAALFVQIKTLERLQETIGQKLSNPHSAPFLALFRVAGRQKDALAGNGVLEQRHEPGEHNADHDLQQVNQPPVRFHRLPARVVVDGFQVVQAGIGVVDVE